jgi:hypothetical protein
LSPDPATDPGSDREREARRLKRAAGSRSGAQYRSSSKCDGDGGELRPNGPAKGKAIPGTTFAEWKTERHAEVSTRNTTISARAEGE